MIETDIAAANRRWFDEVWNGRRVETIDELFAEDGVAHGLGDDVVHGPSGFKAHQAAFVTAFPDLRIDVHEILTDGDKTVARFTATGTHGGALLGLAPTGKPMRVDGIAIARWENGKIAEAWNQIDFMTMMQQLRD